MQHSPKSAFFEYLAQTSPSPMALEIGSAQGNYLIGSDGKKYLDLIAGISVCNIGHQHPAVIAAIENQIHKHLHVMVYGEVVQSAQSAYGEYLIQHLPAELNTVYFTNSGTEAIDAAMKLAKRVTGKFGFVAQENSYHGSTQAPLSLMSDAYYTDPYKPLLGPVYFIKQNQIAQLETIPWNQIAAVVIELVQAENGTTPAEVEYLQQIQVYCHQHKVLLIFDEIQTGFGRTGSLFAFEQYQIVPDVLVLGKALGGGMPMGAIVARKELMNQLSNSPILGHITTFGGHPVSAAAGKAAMQVLIEDQLIIGVDNKAALFRKRLVHPKITSVQGMGLLMSVGLSSFNEILQVIPKLIQRGVFTDWFLFANNRFRICPPLTISVQEIEDCCQVILSVLNEIDE